MCGSTFHMTSQLKLLILKKRKRKRKRKAYYLNKCESERDDELFFASKVNNQTNSHQIIDE